MPTDTDKKAEEATNAELEALRKENAALRQEVKNVTEENSIIAKNSDAKIEALKAKLREKLAAPAGDYCVLRGKTYQVVGTVESRFATDEARKGNFGLDEELVILKR